MLKSPLIWIITGFTVWRDWQACATFESKIYSTWLSRVNAECYNSLLWGCDVSVASRLFIEQIKLCARKCVATSKQFSHVHSIPVHYIPGGGWVTLYWD